MASSNTATTCLSCQKEILPGLSSCISCGGPPLYGSPGEPWGVMAGPIASSRHRAETAKLLDGLLTEYNQEKAESALGRRKVFVVGGLSQRVAEALVERLSPQKTLAVAIKGRPTRNLTVLGTLLATGGAAGLSLLAESLVVTAAAVGVTALGGLVQGVRAHRPLGKAPPLPEKHSLLGELGEEAVALAQKLPGELKASFSQVLIGVGGLLARSTRDPSWLLGEYGQGLEGAAVAALKEGVRLVRLLLHAPSGSQVFAEREREVLSWCGKLREALEVADKKEGEEIARNLRREMEIMRETLDELERL